MSSRRAVAVSLLALGLVSACEIEKVGIARTDAVVAMHAVLSATAPNQVVLLERTRNGSILFVAPPFDLEDPIVTDEGVAESGALVTLTTPGGQTIVAREDNVTRDDGRGKGIYRFAIPGGALQRSGTYTLTVHTTKGDVLSAQTSVPAGSTAEVAQQRDFDRTRDTVNVSWSPVAGARTYLVRVETPFGPRSFFTDSTRVRLPGDLRNAGLQTLPRVFIPGFQQAVTVSAVDSNFYDWYRTQNDPLSGSGLINRVSGGIGVFGSLVRLHFEDLHTVAPQTQPVEGTWMLAGTPSQQSTTPYTGLELYVESPAARSDQADALSGRYYVRPRFGYTGCLTCGLLANTKGTHIQLNFVTDWSARDTVDVFEGDVRGDTIVGAYRFWGGAFFVKKK